MIEKVILLEQADPVIFYGVNNSNILLLKTLYPKLRFAARGRAIKVYGDEDDISVFETFVDKLVRYCNDYNKLNEEVILDFYNGEGPVEKQHDSLIIYGVNGKPISARTVNQRRLLEAFQQNDLVFALGPAGSGKTYVAIALAVRALKNKEIRKIILSRPAVEAGEKLGFLPGEMKDKLDPYLQPLYDALQDMIPAAKLKELLETNVIQIAPLAYMRGRTLSDAIIILDEAQNTTAPQIKMFLTRLGLGARMIVTGDMSQVDLPRNVTSGLVQAQRILRNIPGIATIEFDRGDIVRHRLVQKIVDAYDRYEEQQKARNPELFPPKE
jgi:phosphate starvation-inducible PhoH-like protein